ncbi:uncharacterized protein LOC122251474 isoform X2 [Penaeus japonicus]|uniref:uncharacterized protein LOC122251474 isoform X2 n=1 Tax=Penaeus japonicus TaxID=27405 RepID=UPI001C714740|nr:uncharacterized protein LOC122251474 isoform X2 [Penaeus japonicus]
MLMQHYMKKNMPSKSSSISKGVGGYRPTIDWHEITIKRKNVADRQVLACIVLSGILIIVVGIVITVLGFFVIKSQCPFEWEKGEGSCYYFAQHNASWEDSRGYCDGQGANLLDLHTPTEADFIKERMFGISWLGLYRAKDAEQWAWLSGAKVNYTVWENTPTTTAAAKECVVMDESGMWSTISCNPGDSAFVICDYSPGYNPFVLIGPVVIFCGVVVLMLSIEVCVRRKEFKEKNPEVMDDDDDEEERQVDPGIINYGFGNFAGEDPPAKSVKWAPVGSSSPSKSLEPGGSGATQLETQKRPETTTAYSPGSSGGGPRVQVVAASVPPSPSLGDPPLENTQSQEQLELLLSPKTLE